MDSLKVFSELQNRTERFTTVKLSKFAESYNTKSNTIFDTIEKLAANQASLLTKINDLEHKLKISVDVLEETMASVNLNTHTST